MGADSLTPDETILGVTPFEVLRVFGRRAVVTHDRGDSFELQGDPFSIVSDRVNFYSESNFSENQDAPFFQGGAIGYFAYDAVRALEPSLMDVEGNLSRLNQDPAHVDAEFRFYRQVIVFDHRRHRIHLMSGYFESEKFHETGLRRARAEIEELKKIIQSVSVLNLDSESPLFQGETQEIPIEKFESMLGKEKFLDGVKKLKHHLHAGDIFQAVLSEKFQHPFNGDPIQLFKVLRRLNPAPYSFYLCSPGHVMLGASPEMLLKISGTTLETHPIAGTRPRGATPAQDRKLESQLMRSQKEQSEHLMLVDLARNDIGRVSDPGTVQVKSYRELKKFSSVMHLVSRVTGKILKTVHPIDALASCFPAGTLSGAPKIRAMQLLSELEPTPRGFYGGAVVAMSFTGELDSCISIRSIEIKNQQAIIQAGAGIVADSKPENEYQEILHKSRLPRLALAKVLGGVNSNSPGIQDQEMAV